MSVYVTSWVFQHSPTKLGDRLVLLALADYAQDDGDNAFPTVQNLALKARVGLSTARAALRRLEADGAIERRGTTRSGTSVYRVVMEGAPGSGARQDLAARAPGSGPNPSEEPSETPPTPTDTIRGLFAYWQSKCDKPRAKLDRKRHSVIKARLADGYTIAEIRQAIDGAAAKPFINPAGVKFNDIELICRDAIKLDSFIERGAGTQPQDIDSLVQASEERRRARAEREAAWDRKAA